MGSAARVAARGAAAVGVLAAGAAVGVFADRAIMRRSLRLAGGDAERDVLVGEVRDLVTADGARLHVEIDEPEDPQSADLTVVFCHGYALNMNSWYYQRRDLRGQARLVFYDQRSHGQSDRAADTSHHVENLGRDLAAVINDVVPRGPIIVVGHSMGGMSVMSCIEQFPELVGARIRGVALVATAAGDVAATSLGLPKPIGRWVQRFATPLASSLAKREGLVDGWDDTSFGLFLTRLYAFGSSASDDDAHLVAQMLAGTSLEVVAEFLPSVQNHDSQAALPILQRTEVLVVVGEKDRFTPVALSRAIVDEVPGAEFAVLRDAGHMVMLEKAGEVTRLLVDLIGRVRRDSLQGGRKVRGGGKS